MDVRGVGVGGGGVMREVLRRREGEGQPRELKGLVENNKERIELSLRILCIKNCEYSRSRSRRGGGRGGVIT